MGKWHIRQLNVWLEAQDVAEPKAAVDEKAAAIRRDAAVLAENLEREGICVAVEGGLPAEAACQDSVCREGAYPKGISPEDALAKGILFLTDSAQLACQLSKQGYPVLAWLHTGNRGSSFTSIRYAVECPAEVGADFYDRIYCRFAGLPWEIAETERCLIRETVVEDVDAFVKIYENPEITRYTDPFCTEPDAEKQYVEDYIKKVYDFYGYGMWTVVWKASGEVIGRVGFEQNDPPFLGYMVAGEWQGQGIAYEVCRAVLAVAREELGLTAVQVKIDGRNEASLKLAKKLGFSDMTATSENGDTLVNFKVSLQ